MQTTTSIDAELSINPTEAQMRKRVRELIEGFSDYGATDEECQIALGMNPNTQRPRRGELVMQGLVVDSGRTRPTKSGRQAIVWVGYRYAQED